MVVCLKSPEKVCEVQGKDKWKSDMIKELTNVKKGSMFLEGENEESLLTNEEIQQIIDYVSTY